ncbi:hypothetical protein N499_0833A, partial [Wolbachia pipientis wVitA]
MVVGYLP